MRKTKFLLTLLVALSMFGFMGCEGGDSPTKGSTLDLEELTPAAQNALKQYLIITPRGAVRENVPDPPPPMGFIQYILRDDTVPIEIYDMVGIGDVPVPNASLVQIDPTTSDNLPAGSGAMAVSVDANTRRPIVAGRSRNDGADPTSAFLQMFEVFIPPLDVVFPPNPELFPPPDPSNIFSFGAEVQFHNVAFHPDGSFIYQLRDFDGVNPGQVDIYVYNAANGNFESPNEPFAVNVPVGPAPREMAFTRDGRFLYVSNSGNGTVSGFQVDGGTGLLAATPGSPYVMGPGVTGTWGLSVDRNGRLYVASQSGHLNIFDVNADGSLTALSPDGVLPPGPFFLGGAPTGLATSPAADLLFISDVAADAVFSFNVNPATGVPSPTPRPFESAGAGQANPANIEVDPTGRFLISANQAEDEPIGQNLIIVPDTTDIQAIYNGGITRYRILADGSLSFEESLPSLNPYGIGFFQFIP